MKVEGTTTTTTCRKKRNNISIQYDMMMRNPVSESEALLGLSPTSEKKLRRLPHVFSRVLELPFRSSDADVSVEELPNSFRFVVDTPGIAHVEARTVQIHPGLTKIVVNETGSLQFYFNDLNLDIWRFRLPESTLPELATAALVDGDLIVTVPKADDEDDAWRTEDRAVDGSGSGTLVLVHSFYPSC